MTGDVNVLNFSDEAHEAMGDKISTPHRYNKNY
jgi:hypothetical protein